jgi:nicotinamide-nucleotide amidase
VTDEAPPPDAAESTSVAADVLGLLARRGATLAVAESLTGGLVTSTLVAVPGASDVLRGGVVAYATELKHALLGVDSALLDRVGAVHPEVAAQMAIGVRDRLGSTWAVATTGVAGPDAQDGQAVGTVDLAVAGPVGVICHRLVLEGGRAAIRRAAAAEALRLLRQEVAADKAAGGIGAGIQASASARATAALGTVNPP